MRVFKNDNVELTIICNDVITLDAIYASPPGLWLQLCDLCANLCSVLPMAWIILNTVD